MKQIFLFRQLPLILLVLALAFTAIAWQGQPGKQKLQTPKSDTIPERNKKVKDIDEAIEELEKGRLDMERSLKEIDMKEIEKTISESMKKVDFSKIQLDMEKAMKDIDFEKIN